MRLVIASNNVNKIREIEQILGSQFDEVVSMSAAGLKLDVVEDAETFIGNAEKKAVEAARLLPDDAVLADDSGLCVEALNGAPGVYSARYANDGHDDAANRAKLLDVMKEIPFEKRDAHFACAVVLIHPEKGKLTAYGRVDGKIMTEEVGENGFGYDSLFLYEPDGLSFAQIDAQRKNEISHRHNALMLLLSALGEN